MEFSFPRYLSAKQTVDDRALNRVVLEALKSNLPPGPLQIVEVGGGIGTMPVRLLRWGVIARGKYVLVDAMDENIDHAGAWIPQGASEAGLRVERPAPGEVRLLDRERDLLVRLERSDVFDFIDSRPSPSQLLIAHAFLDLLPLPESLPRLFSLLAPGGLAWLTINFDGDTIFEPEVDSALDAQIVELYHRTMDERTTGGDSRSGRHLFGHLRETGAELLAAGASDWVVAPLDGRYPADEAYFLNFILHFFEESLTGYPDLDPRRLAEWLRARREQIERCELVYIAHQMDFLAKVTATR